MGRLAVMVIVDQMRGDELLAHRQHFSAGLAELLHGGHIFSDALLQHGLTETASGHATLGTGVPPAVHGVLDKQLFDRASGQLRGICDFVAAQTQAGRAPACDAGALRVTTLGERLKSRSESSRVVAVAQKARSANLMAGQQADWVIWARPEGLARSAPSPSTTGFRLTLDPRAHSDLWVHTVARRGLRAEMPPWAEAHARAHRPARSWQWPAKLGPLPPPPGPNVWLSDACGFGHSFPHHVGVDEAQTASTAASADWGLGWACTPDADTWTIEHALAAQKSLGLGERGVTDLLMVSLSTTDYVGHAFGAESPERLAALVGVDEALGGLWAGLRAAQQSAAARGQPFALDVLLTADHGVNPRVDTARAQGHRAATPSTAEVIERISRALKTQGPGHPAFVVRKPFVWLLETDPQRRAEQAEAVAKALPEVDGIRWAWSRRQLIQAAGETAALMRQSWEPARGGDVIFVLEPFAKPTHSARGKLGAWHGGPYRTDRHVPLVRFGTSVEPQLDATPVDVLQALADFATKTGLIEAPGAAP